jgi:hypothetical protein
MPKINLSVPHQLGQDEAKKRIASLMALNRGQFEGSVSDVTETWNDYTNTFSFRVMGFSVTGTLDVQPAQVHVQIHLPFAALPFKSRVEKDILARARALLA